MLLINMVVNDKNNFPDKSLLTHRRIAFVRRLQILCNQYKFDKNTNI